MKRLLGRFPNLKRDTAGDMTCLSMMHLYDYPPPNNIKVGFGFRWPEKGLAEGEELGAEFNREKLLLPLLTAIQ